MWDRKFLIILEVLWQTIEATLIWMPLGVVGILSSLIDVNSMQSSTKNQTGEHTVLGNAAAFKNATLQATDFPEIRIWQDADGKLWTLDHRRLAAF
ncbi:MAG: hypothetical protein J6K58_04210 [Lachnospiraceae bacterium]|nr:hypothetical protein [Lachnospiraceae bacterium]